MLRPFLLQPAEHSAVIHTVLMTDCVSPSPISSPMHASHSLTETDCIASVEGFNVSFVLE